MPLDGITLSFVARELNGLLAGRRIDKVVQPERDEIILTVRNQGRNCQLLLSARSSGALLRAEEGEASLFASCGDDGTRYVLRDPDGNILDAGGWSVLVARLEAMCHHGAVRPADVSVLFP